MCGDEEANRVERLWLAMAVAQVWAGSIGSQAEQEERQHSKSLVVDGGGLWTSRQRGE